MTLEEHAYAIEEAIQAAADAGFYIDNTDGETPLLDLNDWRVSSLQSVRLYVATPG
ncbi:hypothetical protein [Streptomyces sp. NPDC057557]|uniref:hypothetical protein n=1 Tax=Streptomyces sp. NPDC057557 TaxID=3346167 RepID=UPI003692374B